jgi:hypothetical protein
VVANPALEAGEGACFAAAQSIAKHFDIYVRVGNAKH